MSEITSETKKNGYRTYKGRSGRSYASVTTILGAVESKEWLRKFKEENPLASEISNYSANLGTRIHHCNESLLLNGSVDFSKYENDPKIDENQLKEIKARHEVFKPFLSLVQPISIEEKLIWEQVLPMGGYVGFGGSTDIIGSISDASVLKFADDTEQSPFEPNEKIVFVADYKNNRSAKSSQDFIKAYCQLSAYAAAKNAQLTPDSYIKHGFVLSSTCSEVRKIAKLNIYYVSLEQLNHYFSCFFQFMLKFYRLVPKEQALSWGQFRAQTIGFSDSGERTEDGKVIWDKKDTGLLGTKLIIKTDDKTKLG
jgi:hypothetical protein